MRKARKFCTIVCQRAANSSYKNARRRGAAGEMPSVWEIYERDAGICQLCLEPVPRELRVPHRRAATRDHIVPVALGGSNSAENIQLAHHGCNSAKGDRVAA